MIKYYKLLKILYKYSDCVAFEIESYESIYHNISDLEINDMFNKFIKINLEEENNSEKEFNKFKKRVVNQEKNNKKSIMKVLKSFNKIKNDILFSCLAYDFGIIKYSQKSKNLIIGFSLTKDVKRYLSNTKKLYNWCGKKPSNITFFKEGNCIFQSISHEKISYTSSEELFEEICKLNYNCLYKKQNYFNPIKYPYELNDDNKYNYFDKIENL